MRLYLTLGDDRRACITFKVPVMAPVLGSCPRRHEPYLQPGDGGLPPLLCSDGVKALLGFLPECGESVLIDLNVEVIGRHAESTNREGKE